MRVVRLPAWLAAGLLAALSRADSLIPELSFGQSGRLSSDDNLGRIPHFALSGDPQTPQLLSDRVILTPVAPGNQRGAVWAETALTRSSWEAEVDFRANGPERGGGNFNLWLVRQGAHDVGSNSIYTVGRFDGLGLVIDSHGNSGGMIRGFLNDGNTDFAHQHPIDKHAFGHCQYSYRNLGRPTRIRLRQTHDNFRVEVDDHPCFETSHVSIPAGYNFGITAATPDNPDSFEVFKMEVRSDSTISSHPDARHHDDAGHHEPADHQQQQQHHNDNGPGHGPGSGGSAGHDYHPQHQQSSPMADEPAAHFKTSAAQFEDLHNRVQLIMHQLQTVTGAIVDLQYQDKDHHDHTARAIDQLRSQLPSLQQHDELKHRFSDLDHEVRALRHDINKKLSTHHDSFHDYLSAHHASLADSIVGAVPGHGKLVFAFVACQALLVVAYLVYKRRKANSPKKYL